MGSLDYSITNSSLKGFFVNIAMTFVSIAMTYTLTPIKYYQHAT